MLINDFWCYSPDGSSEWIDDRMKAIQRDFLPVDLEKCLHATGIDGSVAVQARQSVAETDWLLGLASRHSLIKERAHRWMDALAAEGHRLSPVRIAPTRASKSPSRSQAELDVYFEDPGFNAGVTAVAGGLTYDLL